MEKNWKISFTSGHNSLHSRHASAAKKYWRVYTDKEFSPEKAIEYLEVLMISPSSSMIHCIFLLEIVNKPREPKQYLKIFDKIVGYFLAKIAKSGT